MCLSQAPLEIAAKGYTEHDQFIAKLCSMSFSSRLQRASKPCEVASSLPVLYTGLERCITYSYDRWSPVAKSPHLCPVPTDLPVVGLRLVFQTGMNENFSLQKRYRFFFFFLHTEVSFGFRHRM